MNGDSKGWFPNGQQQFAYNFTDNLEHGVCSEWDEDGQKISELEFLRGKPVRDLLSGTPLKPANQTASSESQSESDPPSRELTSSVTEDKPKSSPSSTESEQNSFQAESPEQKTTVPVANKNESNSSKNFDPFGSKSDSQNNPQKQNTSEPISPPPAPSFYPFANDPPPEPPAPEPAIEPAPAPSVDPVAPPPPPPPAPTFNPFANDSDINGSNESDSNKSSVQLQSIFNNPPPNSGSDVEINPFEQAE